MEPKMTLPYPQQIQHQFEEDIVNGALKTGDLLSIEAITSKYNTNKAVIQQVLRAAIRKGLIKDSEAHQYLVVGIQPATITSVFQHADRSGLKPSSVVRAVEVIEADGEIAAHLALTPGSLVFRQTRTRLVNDEVVANQNNYIPVEVCPGLENVDLSRTSFQVVLENQYHAVVARIEEKLLFSPGSPQDIKILGLEPGAKVLVVQRLSLSAAELPLVWADIHLRTDRYHYVKALWPRAAALLAEDKKEAI